MSQPVAVRRRTELDALRILACFMVVVIHVTFDAWNKLPVTSLSWQFTNLCNAAVRACVTLFLLISGANFLREEKPLPVLFKKYILRLLIIYCCWTLLYAVDKVGVKQLGTLRALKDVVYHSFTTKYHLWFLPKMIGAYLTLPLLWCAVRWRDGKYVKYLCIVFLISHFVLSLIGSLPLPKIVPSSLERFRMPLGSFPALMLLGYYLSERSLSRVHVWQLLAMFCAAVLLSAAYSGFVSYRSGEPKELLLSNFSMTAIFEGICLFCLFRKLSDAAFFTRHSAFWKYFSGCCLGTYLIHVFVLEHLKIWLGVTIFSLPLPLSIPLMTVGVFLIALAVTAVLRRIPVVGKWLV